jgi:8-oxo-dGTP pyrophosphatase MutT (NUDIX family)
MLKGGTKNGAGIFYILSDALNIKAICGVSVNGKLEIPGGKCEKGDPSIIHSAVRESVEELGLHPKLYSKLVNHIQKYNIKTEIKYKNGKYVTYIVKINGFNFKQANSAAFRRLKMFNSMKKSRKNLLRPLVEMKKFELVDITSDDVTNMRNRDRCFINNTVFMHQAHELACNYDIPVFNEPFEFIDFNSVL